MERNGETTNKAGNPLSGISVVKADRTLGEMVDAFLFGRLGELSVPWDSVAPN